MKRIDISKIILALAVEFMIVHPANAATNTPDEIANKKLVSEFYSALDAANSAGTTARQARSIAERFLSPDYVQHREGVSPTANAREEFIRGAEAAPPGPLPPVMRIPAKTVALMAEGDHVIIVTSREIPDAAGGTRPLFIFNMFRVANGKLVEHWDALPAAMTGPSPGEAGRR